MTSSPQIQRHQDLSKGPYRVLHNVASFLPPASNYTLKQVSRNFADAVETFTEHWVVPFIYCHQHNSECRVGYFRFATLEVVISPKKVKTPTIHLRTGKAYYKEVDENEVLDVALEMVDFCKNTLAASARSCPMPQPVLIFSDSIPLGRCFDKVFTARGKIFFDAPISALTTKKESPHLGEHFRFIAKTTKSEGSNNDNNDDDKTDDGDTSIGSSKIQPTVWIRLLLPEEHADSLDMSESHANQAKSLTPNLIRKSILESFHCVVPTAALPAFSGLSDANINNNTKPAIISKNGQDAASVCGRLHFARFFSRHDVEMDVHYSNLKTPSSGQSTVGNNTDKDNNNIDPFRKYSAKEDYVNNCPEFRSMQTSRKASGVKTSFSLSKILFDLENVIDFETKTYPLLINGDLPIFTSTSLWSPLSSKKTWKSYWSKRMFLLDNGDGVNRYNNNRNNTASTRKSLSEKEFDNILVSKLGQYFRSTDRLLVGESAQGFPVEITFENLRKYFETTAHERKGHVYMEATAFAHQKLHQYGHNANNHGIFAITNHPVVSTEDFANIIAAWFVASDKNPSFPRLFVADDVSLGTIFDENLYFPNKLIKEIMDEASKNSMQDQGETNKAILPSSPSSSAAPIRLLTPWILIGEIGTFSDEHVEPDDLHVWVHLYAGTKLWFVERRRYIGVDDDVDGENEKETHDEESKKKINFSHQDRADEDDQQEWDMFVQCAGDTVIVPPRFRHFVLNVTPTFAVARNFQG